MNFKSTGLSIAALALATFGLAGNAMAHERAATHGAAQHDRHGQVHHAKHERHAGISERGDKQQHRIRNGVRSGELTRGETRRLVREQKRIANKEKRFLADGHLSRSERHRLHQLRDRASDRIYRAKHNDIRQPHRRHDRCGS